MTDPDWSEVAGTNGKAVYFTVYEDDGVTAEDISGYDESKIQLKVFRDDGTTLKFEKEMSYVTDGSDGRVMAYLGPGDIGRDDEGSYFFVIELGREETNTATGVGTDTIFQTNLDEANHYWNGFTITFTAGALNGESQIISAYDLTNGEITVALAFTGAPGAGDAFTISPEIVVPTERRTLQITQGAPV